MELVLIMHRGMGGSLVVSPITLCNANYVCIGTRRQTPSLGGSFTKSRQRSKILTVVFSACSADMEPGLRLSHVLCVLGTHCDTSRQLGTGLTTGQGIHV